MRNTKNKAHNCHINPVLYSFYLRLKNTLGAAIVHHRKRKSNDCIEVVFYDDMHQSLQGRLNTLNEAEDCGFWIICRLQKKHGHEVYHGRKVFQLYLSPVHPQKRRESLHIVETAEQITFEPIMPRKRSFSEFSFSFRMLPPLATTHKRHRLNIFVG